MKRLGVMGTMVWDTIHGRGTTSEPVEEWGGIAYALAALTASLPSGWEIVPLIKVGRDLAPQAHGFWRDLRPPSAAARLLEVPEPNNRVTLVYEPSGRRAERLTGGVPPWLWAELCPMIDDLDALYVNFISGFEMDLETASYLRREFRGPIYADLHSLFLGLGHDGYRLPRPMPEPDLWFACFDVVQINDDELALLDPDPMAVAARAMRAGVRLLLVTLGDEGAVYFATPGFEFFRADHPDTGPTRTARIPVERHLGPGDPTGCGDVFGGTLTALLLDGMPLEPAITRAQAAARRNVAARGATQLAFQLQGGIAPA